MEKITVSYTKNWDCEGYCTTQNITISEEMLNGFNAYLKSRREPVKKKITVSNAEAEILMYGKNISNLNRCLTLTQLSLLYQYLTKNNINCARLKTNRNTMLFVC